MPIAVLDVDYRNGGARAACILAEDWDAEVPAGTVVADLTEVEDYRPGAFYRRELPCLLAVLERLKALPETLVIDANVWLSPEREAGLGARLYTAIGGGAAVVGVAKTAFRGLTGRGVVAEVRRGVSDRPLFVTCVGTELADAAARVKAMHGAHRIPTLVAAADRLARSRGLVAT